LLNFPLKNYITPIPEDNHPGSFAYERRFDIHTGVDLYCREGQEVYAMESGVIISIVQVTGANAGSKWWNDTWAILVQGPSGVILYGEIKADSNHKVGQSVCSGQLLGTVLRVLKHDKDLPMNMLHLELYDDPVLDGVIWNLDQPKPLNLKDPTELLKKARRT
jgi:hypothetical protein